MIQNPNMILIGGTGRSGTNITKKILEQNKKVYSLPFEYRFTLDPDGIIDFYNSFQTTWSPYFADIKIKRLESYLLSLANKKNFSHLTGEIIKKIDKTGKKITSDDYHGWELNKWFPNYEKQVHNLISQLKEFEYSASWPGAKKYKINNRMYFSGFKNKEELANILGNFLKKIINNVLKKTKKEFFVEDNTWNILFAKELFEILPQAKLIHVIRDPRDVVASMKKQSWTPTETKKTTVYYQKIMERWIQIKNMISKDKYLEFKLEDLTNNTSDIIRDICEFTQLPFEKNMLSLNLNKSHTGRWKKEFSEEEKKYINHKLSDILQRLDYI